MVMVMMIGGIMEMMFSNFWSAEKIVYPHFTSQQTALLASILVIIIVIITNILFKMTMMMIIIQVAVPTKLNSVPASAEAGVIWAQGHPQLIHRHHLEDTSLF